MGGKRYLAPAKINLCLHVMSKRQDGYHELCMLMQKIDLCDELWIETRDDDRIVVSCAGVPLQAGEENIAARAARAMQAYADAPRGVNIDICKHIPVAAGLGGGSSDAATVMLALNEKWGLNLDSSVLAAEALKLGADVPFFLGTSRAWAQGIGERLTPVEGVSPACVYLLVNPNVPLSTSSVYAAVKKYSVCEYPGVEPSSIDAVLSLLHNDLESAAEEIQPLIKQVKQEMQHCGARGVLMSGSGPTVFAIFAERRQAEAVAGHLKTAFGWWAYVAEGT